MRLKNLGCALLFGLLIAAFGCSQQRGAPGAESAAAVADAAVPASAPAPPPPVEAKTARDEAAASTAASITTADVTAQMASSATTYTDAQRKFIRTANAEFRVKDVYQSALAIEDIVASQGGFVVRNDITAQTQSVQTRPRGDGKLTELAEYSLRGELIVRVPSDKTQGFLRAIVGQIDFLDHRSFEATDAQFDMLRQQLAALRGQEAQQEIGQAEQQGGRLDQRTEALQGRDAARAARDEAEVSQKEFEDKVAFSTIALSIYQTPRIRATEMVDVEAEFQRNSPGFFERLANSLRGGWYGLLDFVIALAPLWPLWVLLFVVVLVRFFRKRGSST